MVCPKQFLAKVMELKLIEFGIIKYVIMVDPKISKNLNSNKVFSQLLIKGNDTPPNSLKDSNVSLKVKT
jgi:hypothetical protein